MTLADYQKGERGTVEAINGEPDFRRRMIEMGFVRGTVVEMIKPAPLADPVEFLLKGYHLTLRKEQASCILMSAPGSRD